MVPQVTVVGILMIVHGGLATLVGLALAVMGPLMVSLLGHQQAAMGAPPQQQEQVERVFGVLSIVYLAWGCTVAVGGVMNIAGGIRALQYRSRTFVITALFFNILSVLSCYCLPTAIGLMIYGLIVMFQADVAHAFTLGDSGYTADEIKRRMGIGGVYRRDQHRHDELAEQPDHPPRILDKPSEPPATESDERDKDQFYEK